MGDIMIINEQDKKILKVFETINDNCQVKVAIYQSSGGGIPGGGPA